MYLCRTGSGGNSIELGRIGSCKESWSPTSLSDTSHKTKIIVTQVYIYLLLWQSVVFEKEAINTSNILFSKLKTVVSCPWFLCVLLEEE